MRGNRKWRLILILGALALVVVVSGTMAAYTQNFFFSSQITTKPFELKVNDSTAASQTFSDISLPVNQEIVRGLRINTAGLGTPADLEITLTATTSGAVPPGLTVKLDGRTAEKSGGALKATVTIPDAQEQMFLKDVSFVWNPPAGEDMSGYADFSMTYTVAVEAVQK